MATIPVKCSGVSLIVLRQSIRGIEVLLLRRATSLKGEWCQVAGGIEQGEKAWETAIRELFEETQLTPECLYSADICEQFYEVDRDTIALMPVFVAFVAEHAQVVLNAEHDAFVWLAFDDAMARVPFAGQRHVLGHVKAEFSEREPAQLLKIDI